MTNITQLPENRSAIMREERLELNNGDNIQNPKVPHVAVMARKPYSINIDNVH